jgi:hypothetical protein
LRESSGDAARFRGPGHELKARFKPVFALALLAAIALVMVLVLHFRRQEPTQAGRTAQENRPAVSHEYKAHITPATRPAASRRKKIHRSESAVIPFIGPQQMTMRLPYSNGAIQTGTDTTIRVSMSQSELLSLGFPINATVQDRRIVAELVLGDDGLPRAISVPLPLEVMKEKQ